MRFFPNIKRRYDYGVLIFILTFSLVAVSGYRVSQIIQLAHQRLSTILIGAATCIVISICICPVWAGQDLHNLAATNIEKLASFLEGTRGRLSFMLLLLQNFICLTNLSTKIDLQVLEMNFSVFLEMKVA